MGLMAAVSAMQRVMLQAMRRVIYSNARFTVAEVRPKSISAFSVVLNQPDLDCDLGKEVV